MKKINIFFRGTMLLFFLMSLSGYSQNCEYSLEMNDSYGDGWNGANMSVEVNGVTVLSNVTAAGYQTTLAIPVNNGDYITTTYGAAGSYASETSYRILDDGGNEVGTGNDSDITVPGILVACGAATAYCDSVPSSNDGQGITNLVLGSTSTSLPDVTYHNLTTTVVDAQQGIGLNTQITFQTSYSYYTNIWVDFGDDGVFDASDQVFDGESTNANPTTYNATFTIPAGAPLGAHRMRIGTADGGQFTPNPCYNGSYGVTIDATINIIEPLCTQAVIASSDINEDCGNSQYFVDVNISSGGDAISITDGTTVWPIADLGINTVGPFTNSTSVNLTVTHSDTACDINLGSFIYNCPPPNNDCVNATELFCSSVASGSTEFATNETLGTCDGNTFNNSNGVWYSYLGTGGDIHLNTDDSSFDTKIAVYSGSCGALVCVASDDDGGAGTRSDLTFSSEAGVNYLIYMSGYSSFSQGNYTLTVDCVCEAGIEGGGCQDVYSSSFAPLASTELTAFGQFGLAPYTFVWSDGQMGATITVAPTATTVYEVTVTDAAGCTNTLQTTVLVTDVSCSNSNNNDQNKVVLCHNGEELCVSPNAVQAHLNHGDSIGACDILISCDTPPLCDSRLKVPNSGAIDIPRDIEISWGASTGYVVGYLLSVGTTPGGGEIIDAEDVGTDLSYSLDGSLGFGTTYYVTIVSYNDNGEGSLCESSNFTTESAPWTSEATAIDCNSTTAGNVLDGNVNDYLIGCGGVSGAQGVWYSFVGDGYEMIASTCGLAGFDTEIAIFEGDTSLSCVANNDDDCGLQSEASFISTAGQTYYLYVTSFSATSFNRGPFSVSLTCSGPAPELEACTFAESISCNSSVTDTTIGFISNDIDFCGTTISTAPGRFYKVEGTGGSMNVNTCGSTFDTKLAVFSGSCSQLVCVGGDDDNFDCTGSYSVTSWVDFSSVAGNIYYIYVTGFSSNAGIFILNVDCGTGGIVEDEVSDVNDTSRWSMYPNPSTSGEVELDLSRYLNTDLEIQMMDNSGKVLLTKEESNLQNPRYKMNTQNAANGLYFVRIVTDSGVSVKKLIIAN